MHVKRHSGWTRRSLVLGVCGIGVLGWVGSSGFVAWRLTRRPEALHEESLPSWLTAENVRLSTRDGHELGAWFHPGLPHRGVTILLHGMGGSRSSFARAAKHLEDAGYGFLAVSLRSFGDSAGNEIDFGWSSRADVIAAVEFVEREKPDAPVIVIGQSLGAAAAIFAASELGSRVAGYLLEAPYRDVDKACEDRLRLRLAAPLAWLAQAGLELWSPVFLPAREHLRPIDHVAHFPRAVPVLFLAGSLDAHAPVADVALLASACSGMAELKVLEGRDHRGLWEFDEARWEVWRSFLAKLDTRGTDVAR